MLKSIKQLSTLSLFLSMIFLGSYRLSHVHEREISWDVFGYYLYLPATFIHHDPLLHDISWIRDINAEMDLTGTLYQLTANSDGHPMYFFFMGTAMFYLPFFLVGHVVALLADAEANGFSMPYVWSLIIGALFYSFLGLLYLRKLLRHFFEDWLVAVLIILLVFGTNYIEHMTVKNLEPVNLLFFLVAFISWSTIKWHEQQKFRHLLQITTGVVAISLVKPSEVLVALIPMLWLVNDKVQFQQKITLIATHWKSIFLAVSIAGLLALPQMSYWYLMTGQVFFDSYRNPGVGLDLFDPHIVDVLFSFRKGWLIYTPIMVLAVIGLWSSIRNGLEGALAMSIYVCSSFWIIASWSEWWYGAGYSIRPMITLYPVLLISMGCLLRDMSGKRVATMAITPLLVLFTLLNVFQWWQFNHGILHPTRTTAAYYQEVFLNTKLVGGEVEQLLVNRSFDGNEVFTHVDQYKMILKETIGQRNSPDCAFALGEEYGCTYSIPYNKITSKDHVWIRVNLQLQWSEVVQNQPTYLIMTMNRKEGDYKYKAFEFFTSQNEYTYDYLTPEIRNPGDAFKCYIWNPNALSFDIVRLELEVFEKKD